MHDTRKHENHPRIAAGALDDLYAGEYMIEVSPVEDWSQEATGQARVRALKKPGRRGENGS
jgi:hypothetical protein